jgi:hypothetical protein
LDEPLSIARSLLSSRYPSACAGFLSASAKLMTPRSDLDLVVIERGARARWEGMHDGPWPAEAFVCDREGWDRYTADEIRNRRPVVLRITAAGIPLLGGVEAAELQVAARELLDAGPAPLEEREQSLLRRLLTDLVDDLEDAPPGAERAFLVAAVLQQAANLWLLCNRRWLGEGKWLGRLLLEAAPGLADEMAEAARLAHAGDSSRMVAVATAVLDLAGGPVREDWEDTQP